MYAYATRYCDAKQERFGLECKDASNLEELRALLRSVMIRRRKSAQLPAKRRKKVNMELPFSRVKDIKKKKLEQNVKLMSVLDDKAYPDAEPAAPCVAGPAGLSNACVIVAAAQRLGGDPMWMNCECARVWLLIYEENVFLVISNKVGGREVFFTIKT